jgi:hypothetical protein
MPIAVPVGLCCSTSRWMTRQSINRWFFRTMDARVEPAHDG